MVSWKHIEIYVGGKLVKAQAPSIISASRSTDIPAFYADWFFHRLEEGYSAWTNPFNGVKSYVAYEKTRFIIFWSKNPQPMLPYLHILKERNIKCYLQYTLNDYEKEKMEKVPPLKQRINTFKQLAKQLGSDAVIWRFDPLILTDDISIDDLLMKVQNIGDQLKGYTRKLVFSYADIATYKKVKHNLEVNGVPYREWETEQMYDFASRLSAMNKDRRWGYELATCGEKIDIGKYGIQHNRCIDGDLIVRLAWRDNELMKDIGVKIQDIPQSDLFEQDVKLPPNAIILSGTKFFVSNHKKDPGQRQFCDCMVAKDIGEYNTCPHLCEYCYANATKELAINNWNKHKDNPYADTITGK